MSIVTVWNTMPAHRNNQHIPVELAVIVVVVVVDAVAAVAAVAAVFQFFSGVDGSIDIGE